MVMTRRKLLRLIDRARIEEAIREAEQRTSGEICISVSSLFWGSVEKAAEKAFVRLGLAQTKQHNGLLLFVVPSRRRLVVLGDRGLQQKVSQKFWDRIIDKVTKRFRAGDFTGGLISGIEEISQQLATDFPYDAASDVNELPNAVEIK